MYELPEQIRRQLQLWEREFQQPLWRAGESLVIAVSGGPDSLVLLHLLARGGLHEPGNLIAGHLDHQLRSSSAQEAATVAQICADWGVRFATRAVDVAALASGKRLTVEEAARRARYRFLTELAREAGSRFVLTGHSADDQVETVLMHILRGAGLTGLRGMLPVRAMPGSPEIMLVRPLLALWRTEIEAYGAVHELQPLQDASNRELTYFRNRVRHELLPFLEQYNPQVRGRLADMAEALRADSAYIQQQTSAALRALVRHAPEGALRLDLQLWRQLPLSLRRRTLRQAVAALVKADPDLSYASLEQARLVAEKAAVGSRSDLPAGLTLEVEYQTLLLGRGGSAPEARFPQLAGDEAAPLVAPLPAPGKVQLDAGWMLTAQLLGSPSQIEFARDPWTEYIDADAAAPLHVRTRQDGDRMQPLGLDGNSASVSDIMINRRIPESARARWPIVANDEHIIWLVGIGLDDRVRIKESTQRVIQLRCQQAAAQADRAP